MKKYKIPNKTIVARFIAWYLLVMIVVVMVESISTFKTLNALESNSVHIVENSIKNGISSIDKQLQQMENVAFSITQNVSLSSFFKASQQSEFSNSELTNFKKIVSSYQGGNLSVKNIYIRNNITDMLIDSKTIYRKSIKFYKNNIRTEGVSLEKLSQDFNKVSGYFSTAVYDANDNKHSIPLVLQTPLERKIKRGSVVVFLDTDALITPISELIKESGGGLKIYNENGELLIAEGLEFEEKLETNFEGYSKKKIDGKEHCVFQQKVNRSRWHYIVVLPNQYVIGNTTFFRIYSIAVNIISILIGFFLCLFVAIRKSSSYVELVDILGGNIESFSFKLDEFKSLCSSILKIKTENISLSQKSVDNAIQKLLDNRYDIQNIQEQLKEEKVYFQGDKFGVLLLRCDLKSLSRYAINDFRKFFSEKINFALEEPTKIYFLNNNDIVVLFSFDYSEKQFFDNVEVFISKLEYGEFYEQNFSVIYAVGNVAFTLSEIATSYNQAREVLEYSILTGKNNRRYYRELPSDNATWFYPVELEHSLFDNVEIGNFEKVKSAIDKIYEENFIKRDLSLSNIKELLAELRAAVKKMKSYSSEKNDFGSSDVSIEEFFQSMLNFFYMICSEMKGKTNTRGNMFCQEIQSFIEKHYANSNLSLQYIASHYNMNHTYLSALFKKSSNCGLMTYLEKVRIEKAIELLEKGTHTVNEVAKQVGFENANTFRRSFKRVKGVTPSYYFKTKELD